MAVSFGYLTPLTVTTALDESETHLAGLRRGAAGERLAARGRRRALARALRALARRLDGGEASPKTIPILSDPRTPEAPA